MLNIDPQQLVLPKEVAYCKECVMSNQRPRITFNEVGVCSACTYSKTKHNGVDWELKKKLFQELCDKHRSQDGSYDVIVPCSGGKDSSSIAHRLKYEYGMHPLCVTFSPPIYSDIGFKNLRSFIDKGFDHILLSPNGLINRALTKTGFVHLGDHNEIFDHGVMSVPFKVAIQYDVKLVMYGENGEAEYGGTSRNNDLPGMPWNDFEQIYYSTKLDDLVDITNEMGYFPKEYKDKDLDIYRMPKIEDLESLGVEMHWFAFYHKWIPQENFYYAATHTGFEANPEGRTEGTYSKYAQLDDLTDSFLYYMMHIKFGFGRTSSDAAHEVRDNHIDRDEAIALVKRYDGEFPSRSFKQFMEYIDLNASDFTEIVDKFRLPHIWKKVNGEWKLRKEIS